MSTNLVLMCTECAKTGGTISLGEVAQIRTVHMPETVPIGSARQPAVRIDLCQHVPARSYSFGAPEVAK